MHDTVYAYNFTAEYELTLAGHNISAALKSKYKNQEYTITYNETTGNNVSLICSSGLKSDKGTSRHIQVQFVFWQADADTKLNYMKLVECGTSMENVTNDNWIVGRQTSQPNDCMLAIVGFSQKNVGKYSCTGILPLGNSLFEKDKSDVSIALEMNKPASTLPYAALTLLIAVIIVIIVIVLLTVLFQRKICLKRGEIFIVCGACKQLFILY